MKKIISVFLAMVICLMPLSICAFAADDDQPYEVCYVTLPESNAYTVTPCAGYSQYVVKGSDFKFTVKANSGYSLSMAMVYYFPTDNTSTSTSDEGYFQQVGRFDSNEVYVIDVVNDNITIAVDQVLQTGQANGFRILMEFIHRIFEMIGKLFGFDIDQQS